MVTTAAALLRVLAATAAGQVVLCLGVEEPDPVAAVLGGGDITTRVLVLAGDDDARLRLLGGLPADLRLSVHAQDTRGFLADVGRHRFALIVIGQGEAAHTGAALELLAPGALAVGLGCQPAPCGPALQSCEGLGEDIAWLASRRATPAPMRRGGRRGRRVTRIHRDR